MPSRSDPNLKRSLPLSRESRQFEFGTGFLPGANAPLVKISFRKAANSVSRSPGSWLTLLLLCVVLVPSICLLWFMNQAVQNERLAGRQELVNAYHAHLALAQEGLQDYWHQFADELEVQAAILSAPALFARQVRTDTADAVV